MSSESNPLLESSAEQTSGNTFSKSSETKTSGLASDIRRSLTPDGDSPAKPITTSSSNLSLRFFKTENPALPTVWKTPHTGSSYTSRSEVHIRTSSAHELQSAISPLQFFMQIIRASVGTGVLALPSAVANAGLAFGMVGILITSLIIIHCVYLLVECSHFLRDRYGLSDVYLDYGSTVEYSIVFGNAKMRKFRWLSKVLNLSLSTVQFGISVVYLLFVSENIKYVVDYYQPDFKQPILFYLGCVTVLIFPLIFIRNIRYISLVSEVGNAFMCVCLLLIFVYCVQDIPDVTRYPLITDINRIPLFFGVAVFAFESINIVLPAENALKDKRNLLGPFGLLNTSFYIVLVLYLAVAFFGYAKIGSSVEGSLTYSLPLNEWYTMLVKPLYAFLIAISFALQFYILSSVSWQSMTSVLPTKFHKRWIDNVSRIAIYLACFGVAAGVPYVEHVISLTGALAGSSICIIFPPLIHSILFWDHSYKFFSFKLTFTKNILVITFGILGAGIGSYTSVLAIYQAIQAEKPK